MNVVRLGGPTGAESMSLDAAVQAVNEKPGLRVISPDLILGLAKRTEFHLMPQPTVDYSQIETEGQPTPPAKMPEEQARIHQTEFDRSLGDLAVAVGAGLDPERLVA